MNVHPWMPFYVDDFLDDEYVMDMTRLEELAYIRLLLYSWKQSDCSLPAEDRMVRRYTRLTPGEWRGARKKVLARFEQLPNGRYRNKRLFQEFRKAKKYPDEPATGVLPSNPIGGPTDPEAGAFHEQSDPEGTPKAPRAGVTGGGINGVSSNDSMRARAAAEHTIHTVETKKEDLKPPAIADGSGPSDLPTRSRHNHEPGQDPFASELGADQNPPPDVGSLPPPESENPAVLTEAEIRAEGGINAVRKVTAHLARRLAMPGGKP